MLGTVDKIDYDGDRVRKVIIRFPALRDGDSAVVREVRACERIGQGSFGTVYRAICEGYPRLALKIATGKSTRLRQELEVLSRVCTKGHLLLPRFEFGALNKTADLIVVGMELCVPSTLHDLLLSTRITSEAEMLFVAYQAVQAVACVHAAGCIHRDIKLQNFVFDLDGNLKLIDFGLACTSLSPPAGDVVAGTVSFMSPEMAHNALHKDRRVSVGVAADVWSLGIVLFSIFTQRNPYPSVEAPSQGTSPGTGSPQQQSEVSAQHRMNERLLRRVAAGDWQWPVGVTVLEDLKQLVSSILVTPPEQRPTVAQIAQNKLWNLRRRYPPAAVAAFLGVQDDFMLSHDEAHLMRAVEQRSAGVTASLHQSGMQSPSTSSSATTASPTAAPATAGGATSTNAEALDGAEASHVPGTSTPPVRSSLKVVQRGEGGVDGAVAIQVYDIRASTRKRSRPIREISVVMAEETAKRQKATTRRRGVGRAVKSAPHSRRSSPAPAVPDDEEKMTEEEPRRASSAGATLRYVPPSCKTPAMVLDDDEEEVVEVVRPLVMRSVNSRPANVARSRSQQSRRGTEEVVNVESPETEEETGFGGAEGQTSSSNPAASSSTQPSILSKHSTSAAAAETIVTTQDDEEEKNGKRASSVELVETSDAEESPLRVGRSRQGSKKVVSGTAAATTAVGAALSSQRGRTVSSKRQRGTSLRQPSSSILHGTTHPLVTATETLEAAAAAAATGAAATSIPARADSSPPPTRLLPRLVSEADAKALVRAEVSNRRYLSANLLLEHAWLLASFRLTIEEDQERYNITWLADEQAKSAAHPHRFNEMTRVTGSKYKYGFVCDLCDYEFIPYGRDKKSLHYFHCSCGRDLCPECFEEYRRQCTCSCCRIVHGNSKVLREHLQRTGGTQLYGGRKGGSATAVTAVTQMDSHRTSHKTAMAAQDEDFFEESEDDSDDGEERRKSRKGARGTTSSKKSNKKKNPTGRISSGNSGHAIQPARKSTRAAQEEGEDWSEEEGARIHLSRMSVAAMQQQRRAPVTTTPNSAAGSPSSSGARTRTRARGDAANNSAPQCAENVEVRQRAVEQLPEGPWRPFARFKKDRREEAARQPTSDERDALLNGEWIRHFYLFPNTAAAENGGGRAASAEEPYAFVYHAQPGRTGAIFLTSDFPMHSAVFSMLERQFFVVDQVDTVEGADTTRATSLLRAKAQPDLKMAFQALQDVVAYDTNMMKQQRTPGTVSVYQAPRSAYSCNGEPFLYVRWFRFNEDRTLSAFLLSNGAVQVFVSNEYELRWFDENRKFLIRYNGVCEVVDDSTFTLAPAINHLLYDSFDA